MKQPEIPGYRLVGEQGRGTFGVVFHGTWQGQLNCAVKVLRRETIHQQYLSWCLERLLVPERHPNVIQIYGFDLTSDIPYVSMKWAGSDGQVDTLEAFSGKWDVPKAGRALRAMAEGLSWLHKQSVIHTGLTARNVFIVRGEPTSAIITDVGQGWVTPEQNADWRTHAPYFGPERLRGEAPKGESSGEAWDVYAFGVTAFQLLTGRFPRANEHYRRLEAKKNKTADLDFSALAKQIEREPSINWGGRAATPEELALRRIIERCLALDQNQRYAHMSDVLVELEKAVPAAPSIAPVPETVREPKAGKTAAQSKPSPQEKPAAARKSKAQERFHAAPAKSEPAPKPAPSPAVTRPTLAPPQTPRKPLFNLPSFSLPGGGNKLTLALGITAAGAAVACIIALAGKSSEKDRAADLQRQLDTVTGEKLAAEKSAASLAAELQNKSTAADQAMARQKLDHANLMAAQSMAEKLMESLLDQRPAGGPALEHWRDSLAEFSRQGIAFLEKHGKDAALRATTVRTRRHLASVFEALGETDRAAATLEEAVREVDAASAAATAKEEQAEWSLLLGRIQSMRGRLAMEAGRPAEAAPTLNQAGRALQSWLAANPDDPVVQREAAQAAHWEAQALIGKGDANAALDPANRAADAALKLALSANGRDEDIWLLADARFAAGRSLAAQKKDKEALAAFMDPLEKLLDYDRDHPKSEPCRERMALAFTESGQVLARQASPREAAQAFNQGIKVLLELVAERPDNDRYAFEIGRAYGAVARLVKTERTPADALSYAKSAVSFLKILTDRNHANPAYRLHLGREFASMAEVQEDLQQFPDALKSAQSAAALLGDLIADEGLPNESRTLALLSLAMAQTSLGHASEKLKKKEDAVGYYTDAVETWQKVAAAGETDPRVAKSLNWTREQLKRLTP